MSGNPFGPGWKANRTIGQAVRLIMRNFIDSLPGGFDRCMIGHAGIYIFCFAKDEKNSPRPPLHMGWGFRRGQGTVTVFGALAAHQ